MNKDTFAQIGAQPLSFRDAELIEPGPPELDDIKLPLASGNESCFFTPLEKIDTPEKLSEELKRWRAKYIPFLKNLAPRMEETRHRIYLSTFQWKEETENNIWEQVTIPHYGPPLGRAVCYYKTTVTITQEMMGKGSVFVSFKGVDYKAVVFINSTFVGSHTGFFAPFEFEITDHVFIGDNSILVQVENDAICMGNDSWGGSSYEGDKIYAATGPGYDDSEVGWHHCPPGMGIYQEVIIESRPVVHISDIFVRPLLKEKRAEVWIELFNSEKLKQQARLRMSLFGQNFETELFSDREYDAPELGPGKNFLRYSVQIPEPMIWNPDTPWLYQIQVCLLDKDENETDRECRQFGMRSFVMDEESSHRGRMYLNGKQIRLRGANTMGHLQQCVINRNIDQLIDDILLARICHMNFLRLTQRPVQEEIYDYCDRLGLMTQTDLPLFGVFRKNLFAEGVKQAEEMERLIRAHPCNIIVTYINEPFPSAHGKSHRHMLRHELESFFRAASEVVRMANPERVIKPVDGDYDPPSEGLPDNHCYCGWYNGHGLDLGKLHKGFWQKIKPGWMYGCGEFGAEGLDPESTMRRYYPENWLPAGQEDEDSWNPERIIKAQTGRFHYIWFETQRTLKGWIEESQRHQAWVVMLMTEAFRRDSRMTSFAVHLFIDAFPSGWMKSIMDVERKPKPAYFVYREALTPLMVNIRSDRNAWFGGEDFSVELWICSDLDKSNENTLIQYGLILEQETIAQGSCAARMPVCSSVFQGHLIISLPPVSERKRIKLVAALVTGNGETIHDIEREYDIFPRQKKVKKLPVISVLGPENGKAAHLLGDLVLDAGYGSLSGKEDVILIDDIELFRKYENEVNNAVSLGARAVFFYMPEGTNRIDGTDVTVKRCGMGDVHFVNRNTGHTLVRDFSSTDFRFWYDHEAGYPTPFLKSTFLAEGWKPILKSGNGSWKGEWIPALAAAEKRNGKGSWIICLVELAARIEGNPVARIFSERLLKII